VNDDKLYLMRSEGRMNMDIKTITTELVEFIHKQRSHAHESITKSMTVGFTFASAGSEGFSRLVEAINTQRQARLAFVQKLLLENHRLKRRDLQQLILTIKLTKEHYISWEKIGPAALAIGVIGASYIILGGPSMSPEKSVVLTSSLLIIPPLSALIAWMGYQIGRTKSFLDEAILLIEACMLEEDVK
jgi:hypothetical protein